MNKKTLLLVALVVVVVMVGFLIVRSQQKQTEIPTPQATAPLPTEAAVTVSSNGFSPKEVTIAVGSAVRWTNTTGEEATVNSDDHPTHQKFKELNLGTFAKGSTLVHIFTKPGVYTYHNHFKADQTGTVIVK